MDETRKAAVSERYQKLIQKEEKIAVLGLGYVGLPLAVAFAETYSVIGVDINKIKIEKYISGQDPTKEVGAKKVRESGIFFYFRSGKAERRFFYCGCCSYADLWR